MQQFPQIMGIVNCTPDSFSDGGKYNNREAALQQALHLIADGADIIDIGGESTRPGALPVGEHEEMARVIPVIESLRSQHPQIPISIDTTKSRVAEVALNSGATIINDVSAGRQDPELMYLAAERGVPYILMHMLGEPRTMQQNPEYGDVVQEVYDFLQKRLDVAREAGVKELMADVGIGFGKTLEHNISLLQYHAEFKGLGVPLVLGISRKRFLGAITGIENAEERDIATVIAHALLLQNGASIIRVHNVAMAALLKKIWQQFSVLTTDTGNQEI